MERERITEAIKVVLAPVDASRLALKRIGYQVSHSVTKPGVVEDEKKAILGDWLTVGGEVRIGQIRDCFPISVTYVVVDVQPLYSCVGIQTAVEILSRKPVGLLSSPDRTFGNGGGLLSGPVVRSVLQGRLELMKADLVFAEQLGEQEGIGVRPLIDQISALVDSLGKL